MDSKGTRPGLGLRKKFRKSYSLPQIFAEARSKQRESLDPPAMPPQLETSDPSAVCGYVKGEFGELFPGANPTLIERVFSDVGGFFAGRHPDYAALDLRYHDFEHTLQATVCLVELLAGRHGAGEEPGATARQFGLAVASALLHDTGYLKLRNDTGGTGAKYTFCHVLRSCAFAASYLPTLGANPGEIEAVITAINCTGPGNELGRLRIREPVDLVHGHALATADYLGQLAAPGYPDKLPYLFAEFDESDAFCNVPERERSFASPLDLLEQTPRFWEQFVLRRLEDDFKGVCRFLASPYPHGPNRYLIAAEKNIAEIRQRLGALPAG